MIGRNKIVLNPATMMKAVQFWLEKEFFSEYEEGKFKVTGVRESGQRIAGMVDGYEIDLEGTEKIDGTAK